MRVLSLFDGISCGMVALKRDGFKVDKYVAYEIDNDAITVSKDNWPEIEHRGDVFKAEYKEGEFDLLIGGSPCTYWSISRGSNNRETTSSGLGWDLFSQYTRALNTVKPKYFLYENNASMSDDIKNEITKAFGGIEPIEIDSASFSAQTRKRYYWTNIPVDKLAINHCNDTVKDIMYEGASDYKVHDFSKWASSIKWSADKSVVKWDTSGKGWYSQQCRARASGKMNTITANCRDKCNIWLGGTKYRQLHPIEAERLQTLPDNYTKALDSDIKRLHGIGNGWTVNVIAYLMKGMEKI